MRSGVGDRQRDEQRRAEHDGTHISGCGAREHDPARAIRQGRLPGNALLELPTSTTDQVIADVSGARIRRCHLRLARAFDALQGQQQLRFARGFSQFFDGMAIAIATAEIHAAVDRRGISL